MCSLSGKEFIGAAVDENTPLNIRWVEYGGTYGELCHEEIIVVEGGPTGIQVDLIAPRFPNEPGIFLIGDINKEGDISGEEYMMITNWVVTRYRRLLTAKNLE